MPGDDFADLGRVRAANEDDLIPARSSTNYLDTGLADAEEFRREALDLGVRLAVHGRGGDPQFEGVLTIGAFDTGVFRAG